MTKYDPLQGNATQVFLLGFALYYFDRVDNNPKLASASLLFSAGLNVVLDWLFIVQMELEIKGAAYATGIAHSAESIFA